MCKIQDIIIKKLSFKNNESYEIYLLIVIILSQVTEKNKKGRRRLIFEIKVSKKIKENLLKYNEHKICTVYKKRKKWGWREC